MGTPTRDTRTRRGCLSQSLKGIRRLRGQRAADVAAAMSMPLRSFEYFEAGQGRLNLDRVHQFAEVLNADALAILIGMEICSPTFAVRCADNKLTTILAFALQDFEAKAGNQIVQLDANGLMGAFNRLFDELAIQARERDALVARLIAKRATTSEPDDET